MFTLKSTEMSIGKKLLSAFVELNEKTVTATLQPASKSYISSNRPIEDTGRFCQHFDALFAEAAVAVPGYYHFSRMIEAMSGMGDEKSRYAAAFAGLNVQSISKEKLLASAAEHMQLLEKDNQNFMATIEAAVHEKVLAKRIEIEKGHERIKLLSEEITVLHKDISRLQNEMQENEEKINNSRTGYHTTLEERKQRILLHMENISNHIN